MIHKSGDHAAAAVPTATAASGRKFFFFKEIRYYSQHKERINAVKGK